MTRRGKNGGESASCGGCGALSAWCRRNSPTSVISIRTLIML